MIRYSSFSSFFEGKLNFILLLETDSFVSETSFCWYSSRKSVVYGSIDSGSILLNNDAAGTCQPFDRRVVIST